MSLPLTLVDIPSFAFTVASFLEGVDGLALRCVSKRVKNALIDDETEAVWSTFLKADFDGYSARRGLRVQSVDLGPSVFGTTGSNAVIEDLDSAFETWKSWKRASWRYCKDGTASSDFLLRPKYFLRAADIFCRLEQWLLLQKGDFGSMIQSSFNRGQTHFDNLWPNTERFTKTTLHSTLALFAFYSGQSEQTLPWFGLFGGFAAYDFLTCTRFLGGIWIRDRVIVAACPLAPQFGEAKRIEVEPSTGHLWVSDTVLACPSTEEDAILVWMEEYIERLESGYYQIGLLQEGNTVHGPMAAVIRFPCQVPGRSTGCTRRVTNGVEVVTSAVYSPTTAQHGFSFVYSFRIRLLEKGDEGYDASARTFQTSCQLQSRHWRLSNDATGNVDAVDGDGVIGLYPLLREGSYRLDSGNSSARVSEGHDVDGTFVYQSCSADTATTFGGYMTFVPGSLAEPTGPPFQVHIEPFPLNNCPAFSY